MVFPRSIYCFARVPLLLTFCVGFVFAQPSDISQKPHGLKGYITMKLGPVPSNYGYGVSFYSGTWSLLEKPIRDFQIGLPGTWIIPDNSDFNRPLLPPDAKWRDLHPEGASNPRDLYRRQFQTIEGSCGFWGSTQFASPTPKYRMNGTPDGYTTEISSPGWGFGGGGNSLPPDRMGIAQLSNRMLIAPDGLPFQEGMAGELFGVSWMAFPFPRENKSDESVSTGDQGWMLFINSQNFKGPVAYWTPETWSRLSKSYPVIKGRGLDARPGLMNGGVMEVNQVPFMEANSKGGHYVKIPRIRFPIDEKGETALMQDVAMYSADALFKPAQQTIQKNEKTSWSFNLIGRFEPKLTAEPILLKHAARKGEAIGELNTGMPIEGIERLVQTKILGSSGNQVFGLKWVKGREWGALPEYFRQEGEKMKVLEISQVPKESGLLEKSFDSPRIPRPYTSPDEKDGQWGTPGPKAGPFTVNLTDGSQVTYSWYRFVDQPSIVALSWSEAERNRIQSLIEKFHAEWARTENFMPPPSRGKLASVDPALMVVPPQGLEVGYVPIVTRQFMKP